MIKKNLTRVLQARKRIEKIGIGRYLDRFFKILNVKISTRMFLLKYLQIILQPKIHFKSKKIKKYNLANEKSFISKTDRFFEFDVNQLAGIETIIQHCKKVFNKKKNEIDKSYKPPVSVLIGKIDENKITSQQVEEIKPILKFAAQPLLMHLISNYIGKIPMIISANLLFTKALKKGHVNMNFQNYHSDLLDTSLLHLVIPIKNITKNNGPFTFLDSNISKKIVSLVDYRGGRISDETINKYVKKSNIKELIGPSGKAWLMSPYYCLHMGARVKKGSRLMLIISYASPNMCVEHVSNFGKKDRKEALLDINSTVSEKALLRVYN